MDRLSKHAAEAKAAGMSYGKYMAIRQQQSPAVRYPLAGVDKKTDCAWCGKPVPKESRRRKYCCEECARKAHDAKNND